MNFNKIYIYPLLGLIALLTSCANKETVEPTVNKTEKEYVNPYEAGSYDHFKAEQNYPKTSNVWKNIQKLPDTNSSNSWVKVSISEQRAYLMNGEEVVIDYPICSGTDSRPTPVGEYKILEKIVDKRSNLYGKIYDSSGSVVNSNADSTKDTIPEGGKFQGAPMKYWMRLTNDGIGHHIGNVRRHRASHGCIRGPSATMPVVYSKLSVGSRIVIE